MLYCGEGGGGIGVGEYVAYSKRNKGKNDELRRGLIGWIGIQVRMCLRSGDVLERWDWRSVSREGFDLCSAPPLRCELEWSSARRRVRSRERERLRDPAAVAFGSRLKLGLAPRSAPLDANDGPRELPEAGGWTPNAWPGPPPPKSRPAPPRPPRPP